MSRRVLSYYTQYQLDRFVGTNQIDQFVLQHFAKGENICELEQPIGYLHFFVEGRAKVLLPMANARQLLLCFYQPLQLFGDLEIFEQEPLSTTTVEALTPCVCISLERAFVVDQMAKEPVFLKQVCLSLGRKLGRVIRNSALNLLHPLEERLASYILATATSNHEHQLVFSGNMTQIADGLGTSFRHLHRTLQSFCDQGILIKVKTSYTIQQIGDLERRAAGVYVVT